MACAVLLGVLLVLALPAAPVIAQGPTPLRVVLPTDRTVLPIPEPTYPHSTVFDVRNATPPPRFEVKAPAKAPNVLIVLIDDMGFGQSSTFGPTDRWPTRSGFDKFYGFIGGETNQWAPLIYDGMNQVEPSKDPNYHFMTDMTNQAIDWMGYQKSLTPDKPFFIYFAPGATHAPHQVPKSWIAKYKGKFDQGWDKLREETLARQKRLGVVPPETKLAPKPEAIKDWAALTPDEEKLFARQMEGFAGLGEYADTEIRRRSQGIDATRQPDNTLIFYIVGDNGASAEGGMVGLFNEMTYFNGVHENVQDILKHYDELGGPATYPHYAAGWAVAGDTPFTWTKQVASSYGGKPNGIADPRPHSNTA